MVCVPFPVLEILGGNRRSANQMHCRKVVAISVADIPRKKQENKSWHTLDSAMCDNVAALSLLHHLIGHCPCAAVQRPIPSLSAPQ